MTKNLPKLSLISHPEVLMGEYDTVFMFFEMGLEQFHLRKPGFTEQQYQNFLNPVPKEYRNRIIVHQYPNLAKKYNLKGCHFKAEDAFPNEKLPEIIYGKSVHELSDDRNNFDYAYLSPVFPSISKPGYQKYFDSKALSSYLETQNFTYALGGITDENAKKAFELGFQGVAIHGFIWDEVRTETMKDNFQRILDLL